MFPIFEKIGSQKANSIILEGKDNTTRDVVQDTRFTIKTAIVHGDDRALLWLLASWSSDCEKIALDLAGIADCLIT